MADPGTPITITENLREQLQEAFLEDVDLIDSVRREPKVEIPDQPGHYRCQCTVAVRRPFDPETAEVRQLEVVLRRTESGWEIYEVKGLKD